MKSLSQFTGYQQIFRQPRVLPPFFETNLVDPARVVKFFQNDPQAQIRIFYYQYLKLCFELENVNYDLYIRKIQEIINNPDFEFIFYPSDDQSIFNDTQAKSLIMEFFGVLGEGSQTVLQALTKYPILDKIFIHFFRSLLILSNVTDSLDNYIERDILLDYLCKTFEVDAEIHGECIRYTETDIFIYEESYDAVYMAYMDYESYNNSLERPADDNVAAEEANYGVTESKAAVLSSYNPPTQIVENRNVVVEQARTINNAKDSYIASEFMDFTSNVEALTAKAKITLKQSGMDQPTVAKTQVKKVVPPPPPPPIIIRNQVVQNPVVTPPIVKETPPVVVKETPLITKEVPKKVTTQPIQNFNSITEIQSIGSTSKQSQLRSEVIKTDYWQSSSSVKPQLQPQLNAFQTSISSQNNLYDSANANKYPTQNQQQDRLSPPITQSVKGPPQPIPTQDKYNVQSTQQQYANSAKQVKNDIFYSPKNENTNLNLGAFASSKVQETKDIKSTTTYAQPGKKKPFGLNVSQEFTSPQVSKLMPEPYRSNVESMKTRARNFRSSLVNYIK